MGNKAVRMAIDKGDLSGLRKNIRLGDKLEFEIEYIELGERIKLPKRKTGVVCGIYPHLVEIREEGRDALPRKTVTYAEILIGEVKMGGEIRGRI